MFQRCEDYETVAFVLLAILFEVWERARPHRALDRRAELRRDLLAFVVIIAGVNAARFGLKAAFERLPEAPAALGAALAWARALPSVPKVLLAIASIDLCLYWIHRGMHTGLGWRTHAWHHSSSSLYWFSGLRTSLMHALLFATPQVFFSFVVLQATPLEAGVGFSLGVLTQFWEHANIDVDLGPLRWVVITPGYHRIHHSAALEHRDKNFAINFPVWDVLFGTAVDPRSVPRDVPLGLADPVPPPLGRMLVGV